ncbi:MFS transporter [Seohaeicola saemankumensis]|uniref:MFS transporter n=1 Tax=Seohaeicola saemankumensis TaxID=481181 RepID=UPI001E4FEA12|nr:MFS transporter [Seohaeicola saemankumensis]MCD1625380.1 MFS transporter [Seohaeicola saemankumensis]
MSHSPHPSSAQILDAPSSRLMIATLSMSNFVIGMGAFMIIGLLEPLAADLRISSARAGSVLTTYAVAYAILSPVLVATTGGIGRRRVLAAGLAMFGLACLIPVLAPTEAALHASRIIAAAGAGIFTPVAAAVAAGLSAPERRAKALAAVFFGMTMSQILGLPLGSFLAYTFGWQVAFAVVLALLVPCLWLVWIIVPRGLSFQPVTLRDLARVMRNGRLMLAVGFTASFLTAGYVVNTFLAPLLSQGLGWGRNGISLALLACGIGAVAGNIIGGALSDRIGPARTLTFLCLAQLVVLPGFSLLPLAGGQATLLSASLAMGLLVLWSVFGWSFMAAQQARLIGLAPQAAPVMLALNAAGVYVGAAFGSAMGGLVLSGFGLAPLGMVAGALMGLALIHLRVTVRLDG